MPDHGSGSMQRYAAAARLKNARSKARYRSAREFAFIFGLNPTTCAHHENGTRALTSETATEYARYLGVTPAWILFGDASQQRGICRIIGGIEGSSIKLYAEPRGNILVPPENTDYDIVDVLDGSMRPFADIGDQIYIKPAKPLSHFDRNDVHDCYCVVYLEDGGDPLVRRVDVQSESMVSLSALDPNEPEIFDVRVLRIAPIEWVRKQRSRPPADEQPSQRRRPGRPRKEAELAEPEQRGFV
jgi:hypothetical protein